MTPEQWLRVSYKIIDAARSGAKRGAFGTIDVPLGQVAAVVQEVRGYHDKTYAMRVGKGSSWVRCDDPDLARYVYQQVERTMDAQSADQQKALEGEILRSLGIPTTP